MVAVGRGWLWWRLERGVAVVVVGRVVVVVVVVERGVALWWWWLWWWWSGCEEGVVVMVTVWTLVSQDVARKMPGCYMKKLIFRQMDGTRHVSISVL